MVELCKSRVFWSACRLKMIIYLDEAVVECHADEAGADAWVLADSVPHGLPDDVLRTRTGALVVAELEPWGWRRSLVFHEAIVLTCCCTEQRKQYYNAANKLVGHVFRWQCILLLRYGLAKCSELRTSIYRPADARSARWCSNLNVQVKDEEQFYSSAYYWDTHWSPQSQCNMDEQLISG